MTLGPPENQYVTIGGRTIRYLEIGEGPPVVVLNQLAPNGGADQWRPYFAELTKAGHIYALDLPGWGLSEMPTDGYSFEMWIDTVKGFCDEMHLERVDLMSWSFGAWVCALFAHANPDRVRRLALLDCPGLNPNMAALRPETFVLPTREAIRSVAIYEQGLADAIYDTMNREGRTEAYTSLLRYISDPQVRQQWSLRDRLPEMQMPMLFTNFDTNFAIPVESTLEAFLLAPIARLLITVAGFGAKGYDRFAEHIASGIEFLTKPEIEPARKH